MKKILSLLVLTALILTLCACTKKEAAPAVFSVGFGQASINPSYSIQLAGYGNTNERMSQGTLDYIYATCVAIRDEKGETVLMYTLDLININNDLAETARKAITKATGIAADKIMLACTHTHSAPDTISVITSTHDYYISILEPALVKAGKDSIADLAPATVKTGSTNIEGMNCVRHYKDQNGKYFGDNFGDAALRATADYATESDKQMQLIRFVREGKKDVLMVNWQAHPKVSSNGGTPYGRQNRPFISADYVGWSRMYVEKNADVHYAYYLGASGNLNPYDAYTGKSEIALQEVATYGNRLGSYIIDALDTLTETDTALIKTKQVQVPGLRPDGGTKNIEVNAIVIGAIGFVTVPYEMFDSNAMDVKNASVLDTTFVLSCANGHHQYMPAEYAWDYPTEDGSRPYEVVSCNYVQGTGEQVADELINMLNELAGK